MGRLLIVLLTCLIFAPTVLAQTEADEALPESTQLIQEVPAAVEAAVGPDTQTNLNFVWTILAAVLVFFMQAGFALLETGLTRAKNPTLEAPKARRCSGTRAAGLVPLN